MDYEQGPTRLSISIGWIDDFQQQFFKQINELGSSSSNNIMTEKKNLQLYQYSSFNDYDRFQQQFKSIIDQDQYTQNVYRFKVPKQHDNQIISRQLFNSNSLLRVFNNQQKQISSKQQQKIKQKSTIQRQSISKQIFEAIGLVRSNWYSNQGRLCCYSYGTGFLLTQRMLLTCCHNLYDESNQRYASEVIFIANGDGPIQSHTSKYKSAEDKYYRNKQLIVNVETFSITPLVSELCLVVLNEPIKCSKYIRIGETEVKEGQQVQICGYPNRTYNSLINLNLVYLKRTVLTGRVMDVQEHIINHNLQTQVGFSGSPILARDNRGNTVAIGMHSHRGQLSINRGLFFNSEVISYLRRFQSQLVFSYSLSTYIIYQKQLDQSIGCNFVKKKQRELTKVKKEKQFVEYSADSPQRIPIADQEHTSQASSSSKWLQLIQQAEEIEESDQNSQHSIIEMPILDIYFCQSKKQQNLFQTSADSYGQKSQLVYQQWQLIHISLASSTSLLSSTIKEDYPHLEHALNINKQNLNQPHYQLQQWQQFVGIKNQE